MYCKLKKNLKFDYDAFGQRVAKHVFSNTGIWEKSIYYVRDPQGNVMATYEHAGTGGLATYKVIERPIYGSSRLGMDVTKEDLYGVLSPVGPELVRKKSYELSNHLGNVVSVVSDVKFPVGTTIGLPISYFNAEVLSYNDFLPFGAIMPGRNFNSEKYRFGFNTQEKTDEISGIGNHTTAEFWEYDPRLARRWNLDPKPQKYISDYATFGNNPILFNDPFGDIF